MRPKFNSLVFDTVTTKEQYDEWQKFAASFDHGSPTGILPIVNVSRRMPNGSLKKFAYYQVLNFPILLPSFHPEYTAPRDYVDAIESVSNMQCLSSMSTQFPNGVSHIAIPEKGLLVERDHVIRLGYEDLNNQLWRRIP